MRLTTKMMTAAVAFALATTPMIRPVHAAAQPVVALVSIGHAMPASTSATLTTTRQDPGVKVDIKTTETRSAWYTQPVWIAIGIVALVLIIALIAMAGRRNGTTVVK